jgi:predicted ArsR family transcriptional regulator
VLAARNSIAGLVRNDFDAEFRTSLSMNGQLFSVMIALLSLYAHKNNKSSFYYVYCYFDSIALYSTKILMKLPSWNKRLLSSTRGRIIVLLRSSNQTVTELAEALDVTDNAVRAHLATLERDGLVQQSGVKAGTRKPHHEYELTAEAEQLFPKSLGLIFNHFLTVLGEQFSAEDSDKFFAEVARRLAAETAQQVKACSLEERSQAGVDLVSALGGLATLKKQEDNLLIQGISCPVAAIACEHREACQMLAMLISEITQTPVVERCNRGEKVQCNFEIMMK